MATVPTVPTGIQAGYNVQASDLNQLAACATFLMSGKPVCAVHDTAGGASVGNTAGALLQITVTVAQLNNGTSGQVDTDGMWTPGINGLSVVTPGYYYLRYGARVMASASASSFTLNSFLLISTTSLNPYGSAQFNMYPSSNVYSAASTIASCGAGGLSPIPLYPGDEIQIAAWVGGTATGSTYYSAGLASSFYEAEWVGSI